VGVWWGTHQLSGYSIEDVALGAAAVIAWRALAAQEDARCSSPCAVRAAARAVGGLSTTATRIASVT
jgi:hypothetical protein